MNILHMKYAVEIAEAGSINKASEVLLIAQPNLSRAVKDLESDLGITIFDRSSKGMFLTPEGEEFIARAKRILSQIEEIESMYRSGNSLRRRFSLSAPRTAYIADAFVRFSQAISDQPVEITYNETDSMRTLSDILRGECNLGIVRYTNAYDEYFTQIFRDKGLAFELVTEFKYVILMHRDHALATLPSVTTLDLSRFIEISHTDSAIPTLPATAVRPDSMNYHVPRRISMYDRGTQFSLLKRNHETFMWSAPIPEAVLAEHELVQRDLTDNPQTFRDVLIYRVGYKFCELDRLFVDSLRRSSVLHQ